MDNEVPAASPEDDSSKELFEEFARGKFSPEDVAWAEQTAGGIAEQMKERSKLWELVSCRVGQLLDCFDDGSQRRFNDLLDDVELGQQPPANDHS